MRVLKVLIADDHPVVREGLKQILARVDDITVTGEASTGQEVLEQVRKKNFDVVVLDIFMPQRSGLDILEELKKEKPGMGILILSVYPEERFALRLLKRGASGYLTKASAADELVEAIRTIARGKRYITTSLAEKLAFDLIENTEKPLHEKLSDREFQVMCLIGRGKSLKEIADQLFISTKTVSTYRARILDKMKMKTNAEIIRYCLDKELVD